MGIAGIVIAAAVVMFVIELAAPGRPWKAVTGWWLRAVLLNLVQLGSVFVAGLTWDRWFQGRGLWQAEETFGLAGGAVFGYLVITFIYYWWHRARHQVPLLWRLFHQVHHSPQRIEVITSFYKHPAEIFANSALSSAILYLLCGLSPEGAALAVMITGLAELFYHWNVRTPYWVGFVLQRPESHCIHHQQGWHWQNFADLPLWDMLFGTFHNPRRIDRPCGFAGDAERRLGAMLMFLDVHREAVGKGRAGA